MFMSQAVGKERLNNPAWTQLLRACERGKWIADTRRVIARRLNGPSAEPLLLYTGFVWRNSNTTENSANFNLH